MQYITYAFNLGTYLGFYFQPSQKSSSRGFILRPPSTLGSDVSLPSLSSGLLASSLCLGGALLSVY